MKRISIKTLCTVIIVMGMIVISALFANAAIYGDVTGDDRDVTAADARLILRASVGLEEFTEDQFIVADVDENGSITAADARTVLRMSVGLEEIEHYYTKTLIKEPTCTEDGEYEKVCTECEDKYIEPIDALGHDYPDPEILVQVTCEADGLEKYTCNRCGASEEKTVSGGHIWSVEKASCTEDKICTRCDLLEEAKYGHTTDWGKCGNCKVFVTDKNPEAAVAVKENYVKASADVTSAYAHIQDSQGAFSWLKNYASKAKPLYDSAKVSYQAAYDACADIPELQSIKEKIGKIITNIDGILAQIEVIMAHGYIGDDTAYYTLVGPIDDLNYINTDSIYDLDNALKGEVIW